MSDDIEFQSFISFDRFYNHDDHSKNTTFSFVFDVVYTRAPDQYDSYDEEEDYDTLPTLTVHQTQVVDKEWLIGGDKAQIKANVHKILEMIRVPCYYDIVKRFTREVMELKNLDANGELPKVERIDVGLDVTVYSFPHDVEYVERLAAAAA